MNRKQKKMLWRILLSAALLLVLHLLPIQNLWLRLGLFLLPYLLVGYDILLKALKGLGNRQPFDENFLMAVATLGAIAIALYEQSGNFDEAVAVMLFYQVGELFQSYAVGKSRRSISSLMDIRPDYANLEDETGALQQVDPDEVPVGCLVVVQPGEKIPMDGIVREGTATLNTSALTGESLPRDVQPGDSVISGCINMTGVLKIETTRVFEESTASKILDLVENSSSKKSRSENFISRFAKVYTPAVCGGALALAVLPPLFLWITGQNPALETWVYRALTFLVISCPCALVISIPLTFFAGLGGAGSAGVLVKGSNYLEALAATDCVVFDKTGTMTQGVFEVAAVHSRHMSHRDLLTLAAHAECASSHPISRSLQKACGTAIDRSVVTDIQEISGHGVLAKVQGKTVAVGNDKLMRRLQIEPDAADGTGTVVHVAVDGVYGGCIRIADRIKPTAKDAVAGLKAHGIRKTVMLTGDNDAPAQEVAQALGVDQVYSRLLPGDKVEKVEALLAQQSPRKKLAFVGDGINDAPVLSRADVGIAMGALGSDAAIEAADVVLMDDDPKKIVKAIAIARKCVGIVRQNIVLALGIKGLCMLLGALGFANMWLAIFADVGVMVLAVLNAVRALMVKRL